MDKKDPSWEQEFGMCRKKTKTRRWVYFTLIIFYNVYVVTSGRIHFVSVELGNRNKEKLPDVFDVNGAAQGVVRLWSQYKLVLLLG